MNELVQNNTSERPVPLAREQMDAELWSTDIRIQFGDCDPAGIVYTPQFFHIFNVAVERWYEGALGLDYYAFIRDRRIGVGYVSAHADFFVPSTMGKTLSVAIKVERIGTSSFVLVLHAFQDGREALRGRMTVVTTDLDRHRPIPIPRDLREALLAYMEGKTR
ncbi:acyl-CoA thioesterase [Brucella anthropi]|uniref:acyl-CoA thioesterase n=1 Tax=Brucella anthropi TaxID=529 RepID=UPI003987A219